MNSLALEVELLKVRGQAEQADALIKTAAERPNVQLAALGLLSEKLGRVGVAEQLLRRWESQVKAKTPKATLDLATFLGRNGRISEALDLCEKALTSGLDPQDVARAGLSTLYTVKSDPAQALKQTTRVADLIEKAIKLKPDSPMLVVALGNVREQQERYEDAKALYRQGIELGSKDGIPLNNLAWLTALQGDEGKTALDLINRAIAISGPIPDFLDTRGVAYVVAGESRLAIDDLEKAVAADSSPSKLVHLAQAWSKAGDQEKAKQYLDMAKVKGLELKNLHPLEITAYRQLLAELAKK
jgi:tetratricopeptide (TPR) repeat protein